MEELKNRIEAVLFSSGKKVEIAELKKLCKEKDENLIIKAIEELKERYNNNTSLIIFEENHSWKMTVREKYLHFIKKIVTETELSKTVMETLAVIAWKNPALQSEVIKIRTNKAYDHIKILEETGLVESIKHGRSRLLKLTKKFYEYFDLKGDHQIVEIFDNAQLKNKKQKIPQKKMTEFQKYEDELNNKEKIEYTNKNLKLEVYEEPIKIQTYNIPSEEQLKEIENIKIISDKNNYEEELNKNKEVIEDDIPPKMSKMQEFDEVSESNNNIKEEK